MNIKAGEEQGACIGRRILITGGRAPAALDLARQLAEQGCEVYAADSMASPLIRFSNCIKRYDLLPAPRVDEAAFGKALAAIVKKYGIELLIPTCEEIYYIAKLRGKLGDCLVFTDEAEKLAALHSKWTFIETVREAGLAAPETKQLRSYAELQQLHDPASKQVWVLKPVYSRFATKVQIWRASELPPPAAELELSAACPWVAQAFVAGREYCTYSIAKEGKLLAYADYAVDFTAGRGASTFFKPCHQPQLRQWVETFAAHTQFTGQIAFDFIMGRAARYGRLSAIRERRADCICSASATGSAAPCGGRPARQHHCAAAIAGQNDRGSNAGLWAFAAAASARAMARRLALAGEHGKRPRCYF